MPLKRKNRMLNSLVLIPSTPTADKSTATVASFGRLQAYPSGTNPAQPKQFLARADIGVLVGLGLRGKGAVGSP